MHGDYIIQGLMSGVLVCEELSMDDPDQARTVAKGMLKRPDFEGDSVRIITRDGELVCDSAEGTL